MENKKSKGKIIALICSLVVVVGLVTTGVVLAATGALSGLLSSDKEKAFKLLEEVPERLAYSATDEEIGFNELVVNMLEKGIDFDLKISDINTNDSEVDISGFASDFGMQIDLANKKIGAKIGVGKDGANLTANGYASLDEKQVAFSLPELIPDKVFSMKANDTQDQDSVNRISEILALVPELQDVLEEFVDEQADVLYEGIECTSIPNGYRLVVPKASMDEVLTKLQAWIGQQAVIGNIEEKLNMSKGTISAAVGMLVPNLTQYTKDFTFEIYEKDGKLTGLSTTIKVETVECPISATFNENGERRENTINMEVKENGNSMGKIVYTKRCTNGSLCEDTSKVVVTDKDKELVNFDQRLTLDKKNNNAFELNSSMSSNGTRVMSLVSRGNIKNLEKGKCVTLHYDEVKMEQSQMFGESVVASYAMEVTMAVLDGGITNIGGEEVAITPETAESVFSSYANEAQKNLMAIVEKWGLKDIAGLDSPLLNPLSDTYTSGNSGSTSGSSDPTYDEDAYDEDDFDEDESDWDFDDSSDDDSDDSLQLDDESDGSDDSESKEGDGSDLDDMF